MANDGREARRVLRIPLPRSRERRDEYRPRVLGLPQDWFRNRRVSPRPDGLDLGRMAHPLRWWRWRRLVHRLGPYAPDYGTTSTEDPGPTGTTGATGARDSTDSTDSTDGDRDR
jgi:hypothetical protein